MAVPALASASATITVVNMDGPGEGFNDPAAVAPVGGNPGTTRGEQRLLAFQRAADIWGNTLDSDVEIRIQASFDPLTCTATGATLGAAGAIQIFAAFPGADLVDTWYHVALANRLAREDLAPGPSGTIADDIVAFFNSRLNGDPSCLGGRKFYLGFDANHGNDIDLVTVLLHEFGHGLGFANFVTEATGNRPLGLGDVFSEYTLDVTTGKTWNQMTTSELVASAVNTRKVVWSGRNVDNAVGDVLLPGTPLLRLTAPASLAGVYAVGTAAFGAQLSSPGVSAALVQALDPADGAGPTTFDGCSPLTNAADVAGKLALVDRGTCAFTVKARNAQDAGAVGVIIVNNAVGSPPPGLAGVDPTIVVPVVLITLGDGNAIKAQLGGGVNGTLSVDLSILAGAEATTGKPHLFAPNPVQPGSSISHWDPIAFRNQLMEPAINADLTHSLWPPEDLTLNEMIDIGWFSDFDGVPDGRDECLGSDERPTVVIGSCNSGAPNTVFSTGCRVSDAVAACGANAGDHGAFVSCVAHLANELRKAGLISGGQKGAVQSCAAQASIP
jgi:hypothetical protein